MIDNDYDNANESDDELEYEKYQCLIKLSEIHSNDDVLFFPELLYDNYYYDSDPIFKEMCRAKDEPHLIDNDDNLLDDLFKIYDKTVDTQLYKDTNWKKSNPNLIVINVKFTTFCKKWNNNKYKRFLEYIDKNISCKFSFANNDSLYGCLAYWIYMDGYIYFSIYDYGSVYSCNKVKVDEIILNRLKRIHEVIEKNNLDVIK